MQVTTADLWAPEPGVLLRWDVVPQGRGAPAPLSLNQRNHLAGAAAGQPAVWLAAAFDVDGPIEPDALTRSWRALVDRHSSLRLEVTQGEGDAYLHEPDTLDWTLSPAGRTRTAEETGAWLRDALAERCHPFGYPAYLPAAISRDDRSTIVLGMDHLHCDAYSVALVVDELAELYDGFGSGRGAALPPAGSFVAAVRRGYDEPVVVGSDDDRLTGWHDFLRARAFTLPTCALPLGVPAGERLPQATLVRHLVGARELDAVSDRARGRGVSTYAATLAALAASVHALGGPERLDVLVPVGTRADDADRRSLGWYTTTVPVSVAADLSDAGLAAAGAALRAGVRLGEVPLDQVMASLPEPLVQTRADVFMVSWIDYRHLPGGARMRDRAAHHISAATHADDLQLWLSRTDAGLSVRARFPDSPQAHATVGALLDDLAVRLRDITTASATRATSEPHPTRL